MADNCAGSELAGAELRHCVEGQRIPAPARRGWCFGPPDGHDENDDGGDEQRHGNHDQQISHAYPLVPLRRGWSIGRISMAPFNVTAFAGPGVTTGELSGREPGRSRPRSPQLTGAPSGCR
ncbi:hypothetical protein MRGA327_15985 [Mycobacterium tuberculosis RGTB327]|nr:hypothetical protein CCDC5180_2365 [Mycobacterium tuberculosis CCDC5180]AFE17424.1 hypothetical protein MRGA327_15985 [Mycobacterium tuberculosis RGTB327]